MRKNDNKLCDDSALIDAFEEAISTYKIMHGMKQTGVLKDVIQEDEIDDEGDMKSCIEGVAESDMDASLNSLVEATLPTTDEEVNVEVAYITATTLDEDVANGTVELGRVESNLNEQSNAEYIALVNQYYELQEKLQETWQKLQLFGNSSDQCTQYTTEAGLLDTTTVAGEASYVPLDTTHVGNGPETSHALGENDLIKVAMEAAEKAISSIIIQLPDQQEGSEQQQISTNFMVMNPETNGCETDLSTVLKAWFSAGLTTGKYLAEQSNTGRHKG